MSTPLPGSIVGVAITMCERVASLCPAAALSVTVPLPLPDAPLVIVSQLGSLDDAVHVHQLPVLIVTVAVSPPAASDWLAGEIAYVHAAAACDAENV